ncbi:SAM-dependent methyltransferase [Microbacterium ulmi]|uniref:SAM-dependent methyltransferase n=1 Tax=Microbacterium ulmi TaxID=179095 RepID=A0A7Y2LZT2_9MICO|nr:SAM-dependent methyltransferase [Microbacterium ulmi]NII68900.1 hypothetical protein [Microbacterium ulmi]NNH03885.1 SAM-dependent methyltransferase [Microbacterium ulmi]
MSDIVIVAPEWLTLRESADARARAAGLAALVGERMPRGPLAIHDLGSGTGSMMRWLAPLLPGPQTWMLHDWNSALLAAAEPALDAGGRPAAVSARVGDLARLDAVHLAGASLVTASALLDVLTREELESIVRACRATGAPFLASLTVTGLVRLDPVDPADRIFQAAFNRHQRRAVEGRRLLGPDAPRVVADLFAAAGWDVQAADTPWTLAAPDADLIAEWLEGWIEAAVEQRPALSEWAEEFRARRIGQLARDELTVVVDHRDVLAWPR